MRTIMAFGAHPDDVDVGCSGLMRQAEATRIQAILTEGDHARVGPGFADAGRLRSIRHEEQAAAAKTYGCEVLWLVCGTDGTLAADVFTVSLVEAEIARYDPDMILLPYPDDSHQDHRAAAQIVLAAARNRPNLLAYETPTSLNFLPTVFADITATLEDKTETIASHQSQSGKERDLWTFMRTAAFSNGQKARCYAAEGFIPIRVFVD